MASIGEQIRRARKDLDLTQEKLADMLHISRAALANWEQDRRKPDMEMMKRLDEILGSSFTYDGLKRTEEEDVAGETADEIAETVENQQEAEAKSIGIQEGIEAEVSGIRHGSDTESPDSKNRQTADEGTSEVATEKPESHSGKKRFLALAAAAVILIVGIALILIKPWQREPQKVYVSPVDGVTYTIPRFQEVAVREDGKAYLKVDTVLKTVEDSGRKYWMFDFIFHELNGIAVSVDRMESVYFYKGTKGNAEYNQTAEFLQGYGMSTEIPAHGEWTFTGGQPVQDAAVGVGVLMRATDENGTSLLVTGYLPF